MTLKYIWRLFQPRLSFTRPFQLSLACFRVARSPSNSWAELLVSYWAEFYLEFFRRLILHQNSADIWLSQTFLGSEYNFGRCGKFSASWGLGPPDAEFDSMNYCNIIVNNNNSLLGDCLHLRFDSIVDHVWVQMHLLPLPRYIDTSGDGVLFSIDLFLCFFVSKITRNRLDWFAWNFQGRCGVIPTVLITFLVNSEKPHDAAMRNTGTGFVVLSHHSLLYFIVIVILL